jgi:hypothetical protein
MTDLTVLSYGDALLRKEEDCDCYLFRHLIPDIK